MILSLWFSSVTNFCSLIFIIYQNRCICTGKIYLSLWMQLHAFAQSEWNAYASRSPLLNPQHILSLLHCWHIDHGSSEAERAPASLLVPRVLLNKSRRPLDSCFAWAERLLHYTHLAWVDHLRWPCWFFVHCSQQTNDASYLLSSESPPRPLLRLPLQPLTVLVVDVHGVDRLQTVSTRCKNNLSESESE